MVDWDERCESDDGIRFNLVENPKDSFSFLVES